MPDPKAVPSDYSHNIIVKGEENGNWKCDNLELIQGYPFYPEYDFIAENSSMTMDFTQTTPLEGCGGWETIVLPFDVESVRAHNNQDTLIPFSLVTDIDNQCPFWLYEADRESQWKAASALEAGVPYIISMPNNIDFKTRYNINGPVTFNGPANTLITPNSTIPYSVSWNSGYSFRSLWMPLSDQEAKTAMGLNVGIDDLTDDNGQVLLPGSAFHVGVTPRPLEAYVTSNGTRMALPVMGDQSHVELMEADNGLAINADGETIWLKSENDRIVSVYRIDGVCVRTIELKAGETASVRDLPKGIYIVAGRKIIMK